jgi:Disulphide bond corrector protein DsbC
MVIHATPFAALAACAALAGLTLSAQQAPFGELKPHSAGSKPAAVAYLFPEQVTIAADKPSSVDLHFKVANGLHVNSHTPRAEELIPTTLKWPENPAVHLGKVDFPPGKDFAFEINPGEKLSVYTGEFIVHAELTAGRGEHLVEATLHYQACDNSTCMPPHSIPVAIDVIAK